MGKRIPVADRSAPGWRITLVGDEKWVEQLDGSRVDVYSKGLPGGRDGLFHDHEGYKVTRNGLEYFRKDRSEQRANLEAARSTEKARFDALASRLRATAGGSPAVSRLSREVAALEVRNSVLARQAANLRGVAPAAKVDAALSAVRASNLATRSARVLVERAARAERVAAEAASKATRLQAELAAKTLRVQAELAAKTARAQAEAAAKASRQAAEVAAKSARASAEATLKGLRAAAEAASKAARAAAEAALKAARAAAEATARAAAATGKAVAATAAAVASAVLGR